MQVFPNVTDAGAFLFDKDPEAITDVAEIPSVVPNGSCCVNERLLTGTLEDRLKTRSRMLLNSEGFGVSEIS